VLSHEIDALGSGSVTVRTIVAGLLKIGLFTCPSETSTGASVSASLAADAATLCADAQRHASTIRRLVLIVRGVHCRRQFRFTGRCTADRRPCPGWKHHWP